MQLSLEMHPLSLILLGVAICWAPDIVCKKGRLSKMISIGEGDSLTFKTQAGGTYAPNTNCRVTYKKKASCPKMSFYCSVFKINNKRKNCKGKDSLQIKIAQNKTAYCGGKGPDVMTSAKYLKVSFISDKRKESSGAVCKVECVETRGELICGEDLDIFVASGEGKFVELDIQCCGQGKNITCLGEECRKACDEKEPIECLKPVEEFTNIEKCDKMNHKSAQVKITRSFCKYIAPCPRLDVSSKYCSCCKYSYYYRGYKKCAPMCNAKYCSRSAPGIPDENASDLICQDSLNKADVTEDLNLYFSNLADGDTSLMVLCCSNGKTTTYNCTGSDCSTVCGGDLTCIKMVESMEYSGHCYDDVMLVLRTEDSCKFAPCPSIETNTKFCKCCDFPSYNEKCPETCSSCPPSTVQGCGGDWTKFGSHCYKYFGETLSWYDAQARCEQEGANLASFHSAEENLFVKSLHPQDADRDWGVWIGGNDIDTEGTWEWTDGSTWNFEIWRKGEPNAAFDNEDCADLGGSDVPCNRQMAFICKKT